MTSALRRVSEWMARYPREYDAVFALAVGALVVVLTAFLPPEGSEQEVDALAFVLVIGAATALVWRRTHPLRRALPIVVAFTISFWIADYAGAIDPVLWMMFYATTRHGGDDRRRVWQTVGASLVVVITVATIGVLVPSEDLPAIAVFGILVIHGTAAVVGEALYQRSQYVRELELRAESLEADLQTQAVLAAVEERTRIAREMHDIIAHGMSTVVVQAQAGQRIVDHDPVQARRVLETIENIGRDSTDEMRRMLGVFRDGETDAVLAPQPTLDDCAGLIERAKVDGVDASLEIRGARRPVPPGVELTGYRVIQEALANVTRHAGRPVTAAVSIAFTDDSLEIAIVDDGLGAGASAETAGTGHGLLGIRERVEVYDGSCRAGPRPGGGYEVTVSLPLPAKVSM